MATFQNVYYKRTTASAKACYMCYRPTTTVLATFGTTDFLYTCDVHLTDRGFATLIESPPDVQGISVKKVSEEEIRRVKEDWEERQRQKQKQKTKENDKDKDKDKDTENVKDKERDSKKPPAPSPNATPPPSTSIRVPGTTAATKPAHQRYTLHREVYAMRLADHRKRRQSAAIKEVAPRLPIIPRGGVA